MELFDIDLKCEPAKQLKTAYEEVRDIEKLAPKEALEKISSEYKNLFEKIFFW